MLTIKTWTGGICFLCFFSILCIAVSVLLHYVHSEAVFLMHIMLLMGIPSFWTFAAKPLTISEFLIVDTQPVQSNRSPNLLKYAISMWSDHYKESMDAIMFQPLSLNTLANEIQRLIQRNDNRLTFFQVIDSFPNIIHRMFDHWS